MTYAADTKVAPEASRAEIERILTRYGASHFAYASTPDTATVMFKVEAGTVKLTVPLPPLKDFVRTPTGLVRDGAGATRAREQAVKQRWRALALVVKAKLEAVASGVVSFEQEWYAYLVLPSGRTVHEETVHAYRAALESGTVLPMLGIGDGRG